MTRNDIKTGILTICLEGQMLAEFTLQQHDTLEAES